MNIAVAAIGCRLMKDDGVGIRVAEAIKAQLIEEHIGVVVAETDTEYGIEAVRDCGYVIVLDAVMSGRRAGQLTVFSLKDIGSIKKLFSSQHEMSLIDRLYREGKHNGCLIGIEAAEISFGFELSKPIQRLFKRICEQAKKQIIKKKREVTQTY